MTFEEVVKAVEILSARSKKKIYIKRPKYNNYSEYLLNIIN